MTPLAALLALAPALPTQEPPVRFEPGMKWTYAGHYRSSASGRLETLRDFPVRSTYLALPGPEPGELLVLLWLDLGEGTSRFNERESRLPAKPWGSFLHLAPDLRRMTTLLPRRYEHPGADDLELSPFPPPRTPFTPGTSVSQVRTVKAGLFDFQGEWEWRVEPREGKVRASLAPRELPMPELRFGERHELLSFEEHFEVDPASGVLTAYHVAFHERERMPEEVETHWEFEVSLELEEAERVADERVEELLDELLAVRDLLFAYRPDASIPGRTEVDELLEWLGDSPVRQVARDLLEPALVMGERVEEYPVWYADDAQSLEGAPAPALAGTDLDGNRVSLEAQRGKVVLLNFWASW